MPEPPAQISGAPPGHNGRLFVGGYGRYTVRVTSLNFGLNIISSVREESATRAAFYPVVTTGSSFRMTVVHTSYADRERFNRWLRAYQERLVHNDSEINGYMRITVPTRRFDRIAVPTGPLEYGDDVRTLLFYTTLDFIGASEPLGRTGWSRFRRPENEWDTSRYFYPTGQQVKGRVQEGTIFNRDTGGGVVETIDTDPLPAAENPKLDQVEGMP